MQRRLLGLFLLTFACVACCGQVCVRIRPLEVVGGERRRENANHNKLCWRYDTCSVAPSSSMARDESSDSNGFTFDNVFAPMTTTEQVRLHPSTLHQHSFLGGVGLGACVMGSPAFLITCLVNLCGSNA